MIEAGKAHAKLLTALREERRRWRARRKLLRSSRLQLPAGWNPSINKLIALAELKQSVLQKALSGALPGGKEASTVTLKGEEVA
jgi:hypothetical protein